MGFRKIKIEKIKGPSVRDRITLDAGSIEALACDISANGLLNPILVRPNGDTFEVVAGERRFLAVKSLGWGDVMCQVRKLNDRDTAFLRAVENLGREDLSPIEEGRVYGVLFSSHKMSVDQIAKRVGKTVGVVKRRMDLLKMPAMLQEAVHKREITYGVAEELERLGDEGSISYYLGFCVEHGATVAVVRQWVNDHKKRERTSHVDVEGGDSLANPLETQPTYVSCDFCRGPVELGRDVVLRACPDCVDRLREVKRG